MPANTTDTILDDDDGDGGDGDACGRGMTGAGAVATSTDISGCGAIGAVLFGKLEMIPFVIFSKPGTLTMPISIEIAGEGASGLGSGLGSGSGSGSDGGLLTGSAHWYEYFIV